MNSSDWKLFNSSFHVPSFSTTERIPVSPILDVPFTSVSTTTSPRLCPQKQHHFAMASFPSPDMGSFSSFSLAQPQQLGNSLYTTLHSISPGFCTFRSVSPTPSDASTDTAPPSKKRKAKLDQPGNKKRKTNVHFITVPLSPISTISPTSPTAEEPPNTNTRLQPPTQKTVFTCPACNGKFQGQAAGVTHCLEICFSHASVIDPTSQQLKFKDNACPFATPTGICNRRFEGSNWKHNIAHHLTTHVATRERNHACPHCPKKYMNEKTLRNHVKEHEGGVFPCDRCQETFGSKLERDKHVAGHRNAGHARPPPVRRR
ncbi:UNVERIFIED_CONTAM: hypothetical protein HDU68_001844 [Siphonaria sp. JEL0065]|nr:hypothetical protein HDU68_001844 [Siphonaria sp. JEL0065]